ncbi:MBOAT family protein [Leptospira sp. 96542]|nr:MBOAT family protein [Leptospira sp. 96542]
MAFIPAYILILAFTIVLDYGLGRFIESTNNPSQKRKLLILSLVSNFGILFVFKYWNFAISEWNAVFALSKLQIPYLEIILPIGLSFHTFQSVAYIIEVYYGKIKAETHLGYYWVYVMFFPQLVAGPIERAQNLMRQFHEKHSFLYENLELGLKWVVYGFFMKLFVADRLAIFSDEVYKNFSLHSGKHLLIGTYFFSIQIYCDFAGYSLIARGVSKIMGIDLMKNFDRPYFAQSLTEFWAKWHISLTSWFRDYLYIPLGGNRKGTVFTYRNLLIVFVLSGLWHGANWTFIIWGFLNGMYLVLEKLIGFQKINLRWFGVRFVYAFLLLNFIALTWVFFRAPSVDVAIAILQKIGGWEKGMELALIPGFQKKAGIFVILLFLLTELIYPYWEKAKKSKFVYLDYVFLSMLFILILTGGVFDGATFIYFQF